MSGNIIKQAAFAVMAVLLAGCAGQQAFTTSARPGETVMLPVGWKQDLTRNNLSVTITPQTGAPVTYGPGDSRIRSVMNAYPDPVSKLVVTDRANISYPNSGLSADGESYNVLAPNVTDLVGNATSNSNEWSNTLVLLDLPATLAPGEASIALSSGTTPVGNPLSIEILPDQAGERNMFAMQNYAGVGALVRSVERAPHFVVTLNEPSGTVPHSVQMDFTRALGTQGEPWVTHGRGDIMNLLWSDNGSTLRVLLTPTKGMTVDRLSDFKFYVTGSVTGLTLNSIKAYDASGNLLSGFSVATEFKNN